MINTMKKNFKLRLRGGKYAQMEETFIAQLSKALDLTKMLVEGQ